MPKLLTPDPTRAHKKMGAPAGVPHVRWRNVAAAQETLNAQAQSLMKAAIRGAKLAAKQGKVEPAIELLKHTAALMTLGKSGARWPRQWIVHPRRSTMAADHSDRNQSRL
jgi:hypothetical protein